MDKNIDYILKNYRNYEDMSKNAAVFISKLISNEIRKKGYFSLVLSGGNTPKRLYSLLAELNIEWNKVMLFWGDERFVPHNHPESNFYMATENLISKIDIPPNNVFPIQTEKVTPQRSAELYESTIHSFFKDFNNDGYSFDCILLGIGTDGHTASLFPNDPVLKEKKRWVRNVIAPQTYPIRERITLTLPIINKAKCVLFLVSGESKKPVIETMISKGSKKIIYPAQLVKAATDFYIFTDINFLII